MDRVYESGASASAPALPLTPSVGYPSRGNPSTGTMPTVPGPYMMHQLVEEIMAVIAAGGIAPDRAVLNQLKLALDAVYLKKTAGFCYASQIGIYSSRNLLASDMGSDLLFNAAAVTLTIPAPTSLGIAIGACVTITAHAYTGMVYFSGCTYTYSAGGMTASIPVLPGESLTLLATTADAASIWQVMPSTAGMGNLGSFGASHAISGYQKLPGGLIIQWGDCLLISGALAYFNFPIAFPDTAYAVVCSGGNDTGLDSTAWVYSAAQFGAILSPPATYARFNFIAIGR